MMATIDEGPLQETTNVRERKKRGRGDNHTQIRVDCEMGFWDLHPFPSANGAGERHRFGRGKELRMSRAPGRPRSITGRQGLEGVALDDSVRLE